MEQKFKVGDKVRRKKSNNSNYWEDGCKKARVNPEGVFIVEAYRENNNELDLKGFGSYTGYGADYFELVKGYKLSKPKTPSHLVVWEEDQDPCKFFESLKEANEFVKELSENSDVKQDSIILVEIKTARKVTIQKRLTTKEFKI